jgi:succinate dehydrogenase / fumarate reductase membrane anchor subunit
LTAVALVPLSLWFVASLIALVTADHATVIAWLHSPLVAILCCALIVAIFYHGQLGLQVVVEDYVHTESLKLVSIVVAKFLSLLMAGACLFAVLSIAFGS